jgi:hypothetical protein
MPKNFAIEDSFKNGLYPDTRVPVNAAFLTKMNNLIPDEMGAIFPDLPTCPLTVSVAFPFPQYCWGEKVCILADSTALKTVTHTGSTWTSSAITTYDAVTPANTKAITAGGTWHFAAFQDNWFLTNGTTLVFKIPSATSSKTLATTTTTVQSLVNHGDRLILGGLESNGQSPWFSGTRWTNLFTHWRKTNPGTRYLTDTMAFDSSWIVWGQPAGGDKDIPFHALMCMLGVFGTAAYDKFLAQILHFIEQGSIGMAPLRNPGTIRKVVSTGDKLLGFGIHSASVLIPEELGFAEREALQVSVAGRGAAAGNVFVDTQGGIWQDFKNLNFSCWMARLYPASIVVSHDTWTNCYWITDGTYCYVLTEAGKLGGPMSIKPTSLFRHGGKFLVGAGSGIGASTYAWEVETQNITLTQRGTKRFTTLQVETDPVTALHGRVGLKNGSSSIYGPWLHGGRENVVNNAVSGTELRIGLKDTVTSANVPYFRLSRIAPNFIPEDKRFTK